MKRSSFENLAMQFYRKDLGIYAIVIDTKFIERHPEDITHIEHTHDYIEMVIISSGAGIQSINGKTYPVKEGDVFIFHGDDRHYFKDYKNLTFLNIMFDPERIKKYHHSFDIENISEYKEFIYLPSLNSAGEFQRRLFFDKADLSILENLFNDLIFEFKTLKLGSRLIIKNKLEEILVLLIRKNKDVSTIIPKSPLLRISKAIEYMNFNYSKEITSEQLAQLCHMSIRNFSRIFKQATKISSHEYLNKIRMKRAEFYLKESDMTIHEIALKVGVGEQFYFAKIFKKATKYSPSQYRKIYGK